MRCTLLNGSARSTERKYMGRYFCTLFFGDEHKMRREEMEEQFQQRSDARMETCS